MSDQTPPPPEPPEPPTTEAPSPEPAPSGRGGRKVVIGGIATALVIAAAGGAYAVFNKLDGSGTQPHDVLPASTQVYARLDVDPSASQKVQLLKLIRQFPDAAKSIGIKSPDQDVRKLVFDQLVSPECPDVDYEADVKPWLGERVGVGGDLTDEKFVIAVQTKDESKARAGIKDLFACADEDFGIAFLDGYAIVSDSQEAVDDSVAATAKGSLGEKKAFVDDFEALGNTGVASAWFDAKALAAIPEVKEAAGSQLGDLEKAGSVALTLRVDDGALEIAALGGTKPVAASKNTDLATLPEDTVAAFSVSGVGDQVAKELDTFIEDFNAGFRESFDESMAAEGIGPEDYDDLGFATDPEDFLKDIERTTGLKLPEDIATLFGDSLTLAIGGDGLENVPTLSGPDDVNALNVALALTSDRTKALDLVERLAKVAEEQLGIPLVTTPTDDGAVLATNEEAADQVVSGDGKLGEQKVFSDVISTGDESYGGLFVNLGAIIDKLQDASPPEDIASVLDEADPLSALGYSIGAKGDRTFVSVKLSLR